MSLLSVVMFGAIGLVATTGALRILDDKVDQLRILRMQSQLDTLVDRVRAAAASRTSITESAKQEPGSLLYNCIVDNNCKVASTPYRLYGTVGDELTGYFKITGEHCGFTVPKGSETVCPIFVETQLSISCASSSISCFAPNKISTTFRVRQANTNTAAKLFGGRVNFKDISDTVELALFSCPEGEYVKAINNDGTISCTPPVASEFSAACDVPGTAAFGLSAKGLLKCASIDSFCANPLAIVMVFDMSSSMDDDNKERDAKDAGSSFIDFLKAGDLVSVVWFNDDAGVQISRSTSFAAIKNAINNLDTEKNTRVDRGLEMAWGEVQKAQPTETKVVLFLGDGKADNDSWKSVIKKFRAASVPIWTVGLGKDADGAELRSIATTSTQYAFADNGGALKKAYERIAQDLCRTAP
ncbi:MAG: VWA domain-containing protein [Oligoflexales bacterium]